MSLNNNKKIKCCIRYCPSHFKKQELYYYSFPNNPVKLKSWREAVDGQIDPVDFKKTQTPYICALHFPKGSIDPVSNHPYPNAVPRIFNPPTLKVFPQKKAAGKDAPSLISIEPNGSGQISLTRLKSRASTTSKSEFMPISSGSLPIKSSTMASSTSKGVLMTISSPTPLSSTSGNSASASNATALIPLKTSTSKPSTMTSLTSRGVCMTKASPKPLSITSENSASASNVTALTASKTSTASKPTTKPFASSDPSKPTATVVPITNSTMSPSSRSSRPTPSAVTQTNNSKTPAPRVHTEYSIKKLTYGPSKSLPSSPMTTVGSSNGSARPSTPLQQKPVLNKSSNSSPPSTPPAIKVRSDLMLPLSSATVAQILKKKSNKEIPTSSSESPIYLVPKRKKLPVETLTKRPRTISIPQSKDKTLIETLLTPNLIIMEPANKRQRIQTGMSDLSAIRELMKISKDSNLSKRPIPQPTDQPYSLEYPQKLLTHILFLQIQIRHMRKEIIHMQAEYVDTRKNGLKLEIDAAIREAVQSSPLSTSASVTALASASVADSAPTSKCS